WRVGLTPNRPITGNSGGPCRLPIGGRAQFLDGAGGMPKPAAHPVDNTHRDGSPGSSRALGGPRGFPVRRELNVLALLKGSERYVYVYDDESRHGLIDVFRDDAADPRLSLSWFDVAVLAKKA